MKATYIILLLGIFITSAFAQQSDNSGDIVGKVVDLANKPISGATVDVVNNLASEITDQDGSFTISSMLLDDNIGETILKVEALGYRSVFFYVGSNKNAKITLVNNTAIYDETMTLDMGDASVNKINSTGQSSSITSARINSRYESIEQSLQAKMSGVHVTNRSGMPGEGADVQVRGLSSMFAGNQPLVVLDGVYVNLNANNSQIFQGITNNQLANINVNDVADITVLKGADAAKYGSLGANGVIVINTKKSDGLSTLVNVSMMGGISQAPDQLPLMNSNQFTSLMTELAHQQMSADEILYTFPGLVTDQNSPHYPIYNHETDWNDQVYSNGNVQDYNINVQGGDAVAHYSLSLGYYDSEGIMNNTKLSRYTTHINSTLNISSKVRLYTSLGYNINNRKLKEQGITHQRSAEYSSLFKAPSLHPFATDLLTGEKTIYYDEVKEFGVSNPLALVNNDENFQRNYNIFASLGGIYEFNPHLKLNLVGATNYNKLRENLFIPGGTRNVVASFSDNVEFRNAVIHGVGTDQSVFLEGNLTYDKYFGSNAFTLNFGGKILESSNEFDFGSGQNTSTDEFTSLKNVTDHKDISGFLTDFNYASINALASYSIYDKYLFNAALTTDKSSVFGSDKNFEVYYNLGLGWRISSEDFLKSQTWVDNILLKAAFGRSGNSMVSNNSSQYTFVATRFKNINGVIRDGIPNKDLTSEKKNLLDLGVDISLFNRRFNLNVNYYDERIRNMMLMQPTASYIGYSTLLTNDGSVNKNGFELAADLRLVNAEKLKLNVGGNITTYNAEVKSLGESDMISIDIPGGSLVNMVGETPNSFYGYETKGVFATTEEANEANLRTVGGAQFGAGDMHFVDQNGDNIIDYKDQVIIGNAMPELYGGGYINVEYSNFFLNVNLNYSINNEVYNYRRSQLESMSDYHNQTSIINNRWIVEGQQTSIPKASFNDPMGNARFSDRWIEDGSYIKVKDLTFGYNLPDDFLGIRKATIFVTGQNLFVKTDYLGYDPEFNYGGSSLYNGIDYGKVPLAKRVMVGIKVNL